MTKTAEEEEKTTTTMFSGVVTGDIQSIIEVGCSLFYLFLTNVCHGNTKKGNVVSKDAHRQTESSGTETGTGVSKDAQRQNESLSEYAQSPRAEILHSLKNWCYWPSLSP